MAQYDVYKAKPHLLLVDVQSNIIDFSETRMVIPMDSRDIVKKECIKCLNPKIIINGVTFMMITQNAAPVFIKAFKEPVANIAEHHDEITAALDFLFHGF